MAEIVKDGDIVKVIYEGTFDSGEVFDATEKHGGDPLEFTVGAHQVVPGFENGVLGQEVNKEFKIRLEPKDAYGEWNEEAIQIVPKEQLGMDLDPEVGMMLAVQQQHGDHTHQIPVKIHKVEETQVHMDFNHPMAGKTLNFKMTVKEIVKNEKVNVEL